MNARHLVLAALLAALPLACGEEEAREEESPDAEACEHFAGTAVKAVTAAPAREQAPAAASDHHRYAITLTDVEGGKGGFVSFASEAAGDVVFFLDAAVPARLVDSTGAQLAFEESATSSTECSAIKGRHVAELAVGTVWLELGPTEISSVNLIVEGAAHEHGHDE